MRIKKIFLREDILRAMSFTRSNRAAARYLGCGYTHYKVYAKLFKTDDGSKTLFDAHLNPSGKGIPKRLGGAKSEPAIKEILEGRVDAANFTPDKIKQKLIFEGIFEEKCNKCGFTERRVSDYKIPLLLSFQDSNKKNYQRENLELLCYNCYFLFVGNVFTPSQVETIEDHMPHREKAGEEPITDTNWELNADQLANMKALGIL